MPPSAPTRHAVTAPPATAGRRGTAVAVGLSCSLLVAAVVAAGGWLAEPLPSPGVVLAPPRVEPPATAPWPAPGGPAPARPQAAAPRRAAGPAPAQPPPIAPQELSALHPVLAQHFLADVQVQRSPQGGADVLAVARGSLYARLGLRAGDRVYTLDSGANAGVDDESMVSLMQMSSLELSVVRAGHPLTLRLALNDDTGYAPPAQQQPEAPDGPH